jgi:hypothetical protein
MGVEVFVTTHAIAYVKPYGTFVASGVIAYGNKC